MNDRKDVEKVQFALDATFSNVKDDPWLAQKVLARAKGEIKMKKKLSLGLILVIVLVLAAATALAAAIVGWDDAAYFLQKEQADGRFTDWAIEDKISLVQSLADAGAIEKDGRTADLLSGKLTDREKNTIADELMTDWLNAPAEHVAFRPIMEKMWGEFRTWSQEQKVWFSDTMIEAGIQQPDFERYVMPASDVITQKDAELIAKTCMELWLGYKPGELNDNVAQSKYVIFPQRLVRDGTVTYSTENASPVWYVEVYFPDGDGETSCAIEIDPVTGNADVSYLYGYLQHRRYGTDWSRDAGLTAISKLQSEHHFLSFFEWSHEDKALWSAQVLDLVRRKASQEPQFYDIATLAFTQYHYGIPSENAIPETEALMQARQFLRDTYALSNEMLGNYDLIHIYYDVSDAKQPKWRIHFSMSGRQALAQHGNLYEITNYRIELDALTGKIVSEKAYQLKDETGYLAIMNWT